MNLIDFYISFVLLNQICISKINHWMPDPQSLWCFDIKWRVDKCRWTAVDFGMTIVRKGCISCHFSVFGLDPQDHLLVSCDNQVVPRGAPSYSDAICRPSAVRQYLLTGLPDTCSYRTWCSGCHPYCFKACGKGQAIILCSKCSQLNVP